MQSKKIRKKGLQPKKRYFAGGTIECPNPPCPPEVDNRVQTLLNSGMWKQGPNGELLRKSPEELNRDAYEKSKQEAMGQLAVEDPNTFAPTTSGFMTPERKAYLESRAGKLTPEEAREYATVSFDPFEGPNLAFSFAAGATPLDPVGQIIGRGLTALGKGYRTIKNPRVMPIMEEARIEAAIRGVSEHFGIELGHVVDGVAMTPERIREIVIKDLVGEGASAERLARANQAIDLAIDEAMPKALETVMRRSEGNLLDIPVDTRHPQLDRVRMRFLGPNSKLWQQANKEGLIPVTNLKQSMKDMSEMERYVLEEAVFRAPIYNKKGVLLQGEELRNAQDAIISAIARPGMGPSIEESAEGVGDISGYRINLNQLKGLSEGTSATMNPVRSFELVQDGEDFFGSKIGQHSNRFRSNAYSDYGLGRIGYSLLEGADAKTFVVGTDDLYSQVNHFGRGELAHFRTFIDLTPPKIAENFPGTRVPTKYAFSRLGGETSSVRVGGAYLNWFQDMSRVPSGLGYKRGGNLDMPPGYITPIENAVYGYLNNDVTSKGVTDVIGNALDEIATIRREAGRITASMRDIHFRAADVSSGRGSIVGPKGDYFTKALLDFANLPNRRELVEKAASNILVNRNDALLYEGTVSYVNKALDDLVNGVTKEQDLLARFGEADLPKPEIEPKLVQLGDVKNYLSTYEDAVNTLTESTFIRIRENSQDYRVIMDKANSDFSFGSWADMDLSIDLDQLQGTTIPTARNRFFENIENKVDDLSKIILSPNTLPEVEQAGYVLRAKLMDFKKQAAGYFEGMEELADAAAYTHNELMKKYVKAEVAAKDRGVPDNILMKTAVEEIEAKYGDDVRDLKLILQDLETARLEAVLAMERSAKTLGQGNEDVVKLLPDLYEGVKAETKNSIDRVLQDQAALDYYDVLKTQNEVKSIVGGIREDVESGLMDSPELNNIFLENTNKNRFFVSEIQSDYVQKSSGKAKDEISVISSPGGSYPFKPTKKGERVELDSFTKNWRTKTIQQAVIQGRKAGKNEILFPTYKTADKIQGWSGSKDTGTAGTGNRITYQNMDKHIQKATGIKPKKVTDDRGNEWWSITLNPDQKYEFPDFKRGGKIRLRKK
jgi:hypothetical protein